MATGAITPKVFPKLIAITRAAELLECDPRELDRAVAAGELEAFLVGQRLMVRRDALIGFVQRADS